LLVAVEMFLRVRAGLPLAKAVPVVRKAKVALVAGLLAKSL
jgi:hypothetical protein